MSPRDEGVVREKDPTRLCPTCRMPISILAIRCRFCGSEVGRPRKEQETLTIKDLGGEHKSSYTLSGNVTEALESFLLEERAQKEEKEREREALANKSLFRRRKTPPPETRDSQLRKANSGLPELDTDRRDLASNTMSTSQSRSTAFRTTSPERMLAARLLVVAAIGVGLVALYFVATFSWGYLQNYVNPHTTSDEFIYPNRAEEMLAATGDAVAAYEEALTALHHNNTQENRVIADRIRSLLLQDIANRAYSRPFSMASLNSASADITRIAQRDVNAAVVQMLETINRETAYFKFILSHLDIEEQEAVFRLNNPFITEKEQTVSPGDLLQGRFLIKDISTKGVLLEDISDAGAGRQLISRPMAPITHD